MFAIQKWKIEFQIEICKFIVYMYTLYTFWRAHYARPNAISRQKQPKLYSIITHLRLSANGYLGTIISHSISIVYILLCFLLHQHIYKHTLNVYKSSSNETFIANFTFFAAQIETVHVVYGCRQMWLGLSL